MPIIKSEYIRRKLSYIKSMVEDDSKQKLYDINTSAEYIFMQILNDVYGWNLINANEEKPNFPAIDLIDTVNETVFQVTSEISTKKVREDTIEKFNELVKKDEYKKYAHYKIKMFYIKNKPNFSDKILEEFASKGVPKSHLYGIEDINIKVSANSNTAQKVFKTLCKLLYDKVCDSDISPQLTTKLGKSTLIGREKELQEIDEQLKASKTLLIKGIGGVGKSTIASNYLHRHKDEYDYYGFFEGLESFESELEGAFKLEIEQGQDRLDRVLRELIKLEPTSNKLLVIDDVKEIKENQEKLDKILGLEHNGYRVLLTSRFKVKNVDLYPLSSLSPLDAQKLFLDNYITDEIEKVNKITEYLDYHPLFVDLVSKTIENEDYSLAEVIKKFELGELAKIEFIDEEEGNKTSFNQNLKELFEMQKKSLKDEYLLLLKQLAILPSIDIELSSLEKIFDRKLKSRLNFLVSQGWLIANEGNYKLHQIIKISLIEEDFIEYKNITFLLENIGEYITPQNARISIQILAKYIPIIESILSIFRNEEDEYIIGILDSITFLYYSLGLYMDALKYQNYALNIRKRLYGDESEHTATSYNILGLIEHTKLNWEDALFLYDKSRKIWEETLDSNHMNLSIAYNNLAGLYENLGNNKEALKFSKLSLAITKSIYGDNHLETATNYNNLGEIYDSLKDWDNTFLYYNLALEIRLKELGELHEYTAICYNNLAVTYEKIKEYKKSLFYYEKSLEIREKLLGKYHPLTGDSYSNIGLLFKEIKECEKAEFFIKKAIEVCSKSNYQDYRLKANEVTLKKIMTLMKKQKKAKFKDKGRYCIDV